MRKFHLFSAVLSLFLLVPASIIWAQTVSSQKGLTTAVFTTREGKIKVYLPDDIRSGDVISGTITMQPYGEHKDRTEMMKYTIRINGNSFPMDSVPALFTITLPAGSSAPVALEVNDTKGKSIGQLNCPVEVGNGNPVQQGCVLPSHALVGDALKITGPFDGNAANTQCVLNEQPVQILAESPRQCQLMYPQNGQGIKTMQLTENGKGSCSRNISGVELLVSAGKLNLRRGENTYVDVTITGLQGLSDTCILTVINTTPEVVAMSPSNNVVVSLIPDSMASGTYNRRFDINSIRTGGFIVNVDLSMPEDWLNPYPGDGQPPSCKCSVNASIVKRTINNPRPTFARVVQRSCAGDPKLCGEGTVTQFWEIVSGKENADIADESHSKSIVTIQPKNTGKFILKLIVINTCSNGTFCTDEKFCNEKGEEVPAQEDKPGETVSQPGGKEQQSKSCKCDAKVKIIEEANRGTEIDFKAEATAECTGVYGVGVNTFVVCDVKKKTFTWFVKDGKEEAEIKGDATAESVTIKRKSNKGFTLAVKLIVECLDGTTCEAEDEVAVPPIPDLGSSCGFHLKHSDPVKMSGGLIAKYIVSGMKIKRDDFIALGAEGLDYDLVTLSCVKIDPCKDVTETKQYVLNGRVRFEWHIISGDGRFVSLGSLPGHSSADGDQAIFMPPAIPLPVLTDDTSAVTHILLHVIDDNPGQPQDAKVNSTITITVSRKKKDPEYYHVDVSSKDKYKLPAPPPVKNSPGTCKIIGEQPWIPGKDLAKPVIGLPMVEGNDAIINGQWMILQVTNRSDMDRLRASCKSSSNPPCITSGAVNRDYGDNISYTWTVKEGEGYFITGNGANLANTVVTTGGYVLYAAPGDLKGKDQLSVRISCKGSNPNKGVRDDKDTETGTLDLVIHQGGVKITPVELTWLPEAANHVELSSALHYKTTIGKMPAWVAAPPHFKRVHFLQLSNVSNEKGICMNDPLPVDAKKARDLRLKEETGIEVFDEGDIKAFPENKGYFLQARTIAPSTTTRIKVHSEDYGAFGFLTSFANTVAKGGIVVSKKGPLEKRNVDEPLYISVPLLQNEVQHPSMVMGRGKYDHPDNRVSIPRDVDGNRIADGGWIVLINDEEKKLEDPPFMINDVDELPPGDGFKGDGLTNYEEYRGFMYIKSSTEKKGTASITVDKTLHRRTDHQVKTVFIRNEDPASLKLDRYIQITGLEVVDINAAQYQGDDKRVVNFNYNTKETHIIDQLGLHLLNGGKHEKLLGIANTKTKQPARPNEVISVVVYKEKVQQHVDEINKKVDEFNADIEKRKKVPGGYKKLSMEEKMASVVAHELLHANNVCHHGEGDESLDDSHDAMSGLRSGNIDCVMRYDNTGTKIKDTTHFPELPGTALCTSPTGTSYNTPVEVRVGERKVKVEERGYGNCAPGRGNCAGQIRISGVGVMPPPCPKPK